MNKTQEALKLAREMLIENREYIQLYERPSYLALYDKAIARVEEAQAHAPTELEQPAPAPEVREQQGWRADVQKVRDALDPDDWCGDERMIDALDRALAKTPCCKNMAAGTSCLADPLPDCPMLSAAPAQQQEQEPVAWKDEQGNVRMTLDAGKIQSSVGYVYSVHGERIKNACVRSDVPNGTPLYTSSPEQQEELQRLRALVRAQQATIEKLEAQQQEPYGWKVYGVNSLFMGEFAESDAKAEAKRIGGTCITFPLYTSPPASKPWVGLTDEERADLFEGTAPYYNELDYAEAIEAKLREKNT